MSLFFIIVNTKFAFWEETINKLYFKIYLKDLKRSNNLMR
jgi:hypothetical protein